MIPERLTCLCCVGNLATQGAAWALFPGLDPWAVAGVSTAAWALPPLAWGFWHFWAGRGKP